MASIRRTAGVVFAVIGCAVVFVLAVAVGLLLHLDTSATRTVVVNGINAALASSIPGRITIEHVERLGLHEIAGVKVRVLDPEGQVVLRASGVRTRASVLHVICSALFGRGPIRIDLDEVRVARIDVALDTGPDGDLRLANAFASAPEPPSAAEGADRRLRLDIDRILLGHATLHGRPPRAPFAVDAEIANLAGRAYLDTSGLRLAIERSAIAARGLPYELDPRGSVRGTLSLPKGRTPMTLDASFDGTIRGMPATMTASADGAKLDASLDVRDARGEHVSSLSPRLDVDGPVTIQAEAHGELPRVDVSLDLRLARATAKATALITTGTPTKIDGTLQVRALDLSAILDDAPESDLGLDAHGTAAFDQGGPQATLTIDTLPGRLAGRVVPRASIRGTVTKSRADLHANVKHASMRADVAATVAPLSNPDVSFRLDLSVSELSRLPIVGRRTAGAAWITSSGRIDLGNKRVDASLVATGTALELGAVSVGSARVRATVDGDLKRLAIDAKGRADRIQSGKIELASLVAAARITRTPSEILLTSPAIEAVRDGIVMNARARKVRLSPPRVTIDGAAIEGLGAPVHADVARDASETRMRIEAPSIDLARIGRLLGLEGRLRGGTVVANADLSFDGRQANGELRLRLRDGSIGRLDGVEVSLEASAQEQLVDIDLRGRLGKAGHVALSTRDLKVEGGVMRADGWRRAIGVVSLESDVDLGETLGLLPEGTIPVAALAGRFDASGTFARASPEALPEVVFHAQTRGLLVVPSHAPSDVADPGRTTSGLDVGVDVLTDEPSGFTEVSWRLVGANGAVAAFDAKMRLPYDALAAAPAKARYAVVRAPIQAKLVVPERSVADLAPGIVPPELEGHCGADIELFGTLLDPRLRGEFHASNVRWPDDPMSTAADANAVADYDGAAVRIAASVKAQDRPLLDLHSRLELRFAELVEPPRDRPVQWTASARAHLAEFPIRSIAYLSRRPAHGHVSGDFVLEGLHRNATLRAELDLERVQIGRVRYGSGHVLATADGNDLRAGVRLQDSGSSIDAHLDARARWGAALMPSLAPGRPLRGTLQATQFRLAALQPFVSSELNGLDGVLDASVAAELDPAARDLALDGTLSLRNGGAHIAALGQEVHAVNADVALARDGTIVVKELHARSATGEIDGSARLELQGLGLRRASGNLRIPKDRPVDFTLRGEPIGQVSGVASVEAQRGPDGNMSARVDVPTLAIELPQALKTGVQELEEHPKVRVGVLRDDGRFVRLPMDRGDLRGGEDGAADASKLVVVDVTLGRVVVERGNTLRAVLSGHPRLVIGENTRITGKIEAKEGSIEVQGKEFELERAIMTFTGEAPPNPTVVATASWTAADKTQVFAEFAGPVEGGKVHLRSEPPRPQNEILALILFGTADGANPVPGVPGRRNDGTTKAAVGLGGALAAQGLTEAIDDLTGVQATARIDTTLPNNPRPEIEFQISPRISIEFARVIGTPPVFAPDKNLATFEWRFKSNWSLETTFGDRGTAKLDALWQKRY